MTTNAHDDIRQLIALGDAAADSGKNRVREHLETCADCRAYFDSVGNAVRALRSLSLAADSRLVRATQMRVRFHAARLRETRQRMWMLAAGCLFVGISASLTLPFLWQFSAWIGEQAGVSEPIWQAGFILFGIVPALAVSVLLLLRGSSIKREHHSRHWQ